MLSINDFSVCDVDIEEFRSLLKQNRSKKSGNIYRILLSDAEVTDVDYLPAAARSAPKSEFAQLYEVVSQYCYAEQYAYLLDDDCCLVPRSGAVLRSDGRAIAETVYPSSGNRRLEEYLGIDEDLEPCLKRAATVPAEHRDACFSPLHSRWATVYFHMFTETLVHDHTLRRTGLRPHLHYALPSDGRGLSGVIRDLCARPGDHTTHTEILRVPRVVFTTYLYRHAQLSSGFSGLVADLRRHFAGDGAMVEGTGRAIYVSREGAIQRPMTNEADVTAVFRSFGFDIVHAENLPFTEQIRRFADARIVAGAHGAGLANAAFMPPESILYELRPMNREGESPMWNDSYRKLAAQQRLKYGFDIFENPVNSNEWAVDLRTLERRLAELTSSRAVDRTGQIGSFRGRSGLTA